MKVEQWKLSDVKPYENNPRLNDSAIDSVARSIQEFGFRQPIVVDEEGDRAIIGRPPENVLELLSP